MFPVQKISREQARALQGIFFDLDETILEEGKLSAEAYSTLFRLRGAGLRLIALTGRPASWAQVIARMWPIEAAIAENGAIAYRSDSKALVTLDTASREERKKRTAQLQSLVLQVRKLLPVLCPADDVTGRISDFTFDIGEFKCVNEETIAQAISFALEQRARTTRSSIHLHLTFDHSDKATGALSYLRSQGQDSTRARNNFAFIGDSENDAPAFAAFKTSVGVRNLTGHFSIPPRYQTKNYKSQGFREFAEHLLEQRQS